MNRIPKKEPRPVAIVEYIVTAALLFVAIKLADSDFTTISKVVRFCSSLAVGLVLCAISGFVYRRLHRQRAVVHTGEFNRDV